jgi:hypothetical protein
MYKKALFAHGARGFKPYKYKYGRGAAGCGFGSSAGSSSNMDNYLLGLVRNVSINSKAKKKSKGNRGAGLKLIR